MNEHADFYLARLPEPTTILGLRLRPFSLGHLLLLHRIGSYFVGDDEKLTYEDLALSVLICSRTYVQAVETFDDPDLSRFMAQWAARLTGRGFLTAIGLRRLRTIDLPGKAAEFAAYMARGRRKIDYVNKGDGQSIPLPLVQIIRVTLLQEFGGLTDAVLVDRPWGLCEEDYITIHALKGNVTVYDRDVLTEQRDVAKAHYERLVASGVIKAEPNGAN